jgi:hypothetical protein
MFINEFIEPLDHFISFFVFEDHATHLIVKLPI